MSTKKIGLTLIVVILIAGSYFIYNQQASNSTDNSSQIVSYNVQKDDIEIGFEAEGKYTVEVIEPTFAISGTISSIKIKLGDEVKKGQILATLDNSESYYNMINAKANYDKAIANQNAVDANYKAVNKDDFNSDNYLYYEEQNNQYEKATKAAEALYNKSLSTLSQNNLYSPVDGVIVNIYFDLGQSVQNQSSPIFSIIPNDNHNYVVTYIEDLDIKKVKQDMPIKFEPDAIEGESKNGKVAFISPISITDNNGLVTYKILAQLDNTDELYDGFIGTVKFLSKFKNDVIIVPNKAVKMIDGKQYVFSYPNIEEKIEITTGLTDGNVVEVIEGLNVNDTISIPE